MTVIVSNGNLKYIDNSSALLQRMLSVKFNNVIKDEDRYDVIEDLKDDIGQFIYYIIQLKNIQKTINCHKNDYQNSSDSVMAWLNENIEYKESSFEYIGCKRLITETINNQSEQYYLNCENELYPNYLQFCLKYGLTYLNHIDFSNSVIDLCNNIIFKLKKHKVEKVRKAQGYCLTNLYIKNFLNE